MTTVQRDMSAPQFAIAIAEVPGEQEILMLEITTASSRYQCTLATAGNYREVADKLAESIRRVGADMKQTPGLVIVKEMPDGLRPRKTQRRQ